MEKENDVDTCEGEASYVSHVICMSLVKFILRVFRYTTYNDYNHVMCPLHGGPLMGPAALSKRCNFALEYDSIFIVIIVFCMNNPETEICRITQCA